MGCKRETRLGEPVGDLACRLRYGGHAGAGDRVLQKLLRHVDATALQQSQHAEQRVFIGIGFAVPIENAAAAAGMSPF